MLVPTKPYIWEGFADPYDYLSQANTPLTDIEFYSPSYYEGSVTYQRAFTVPLFYKTVNNEIDVIINLQKLLYVFSILFFIYVITLYLTKNTYKYAFIALIIIWALSWNMLGWVNIILSESISTSLFFIWISSFLLLQKKPFLLYSAFHIITLFLLIFSKDSWAIPLMSFYSLFAILSYFLYKNVFKKSLIAVAVCFSFLLLNNVTATNGARHRTPLLNSIVLRVMPQEEYFNWFIERGMPQGELLKTNYQHTSEHFQNIYPLYKDPAFYELRKWIVTEGKGYYIKFLITHPSYLFMLNETKDDLRAVISKDYHTYIGGPKSISNVINTFSPFLTNFLMYVFPLLTLLVAYVAIKKRAFLSITLSCLMTMSISYLLISYNGDNVEIERHLYPMHVIIECSSIIAIFLIVMYWKTIKSLIPKKY